MMLVNLLIPYVPLSGHHDPILEEFTYGDIGARGRKLKKDLSKGDYVFLHTTIRGKRYITAYYVIDRVLGTAEAVKNKALVAKYRNPHIKEFLAGERDYEDDVLIFGDPILSKKLARPLRFDRTLAEKLSLQIPFRKGFTETQCVGSATRQWRELTKNDVEVLLAEIERIEKEGLGMETVLSTDEVLEIREADLENFIVKNSQLIEPGLILKDRQLDTQEGRLDLLFEDKNGKLVVVELKLNEIGRKAINQLRRYMRQVEKDTKKEVRGAIVCKDILPAFADEFKKLRDVKIFCYRWRLTTYPREWEE